MCACNMGKKEYFFMCLNERHEQTNGRQFFTASSKSLGKIKIFHQIYGLRKKIFFIYILTGDAVCVKTYLIVVDDEA